MPFEVLVPEAPKKAPRVEVKREKMAGDIDHLNLIGPLPKGSDGLVPLAAEVSVDFLDHAENMLFADYLHFVGATYLEYRRAVKARPDDNLNIILRDLHRQIVRDRLARVEKLHGRYAQESATSINRQVETTRDHGKIFDMSINDLEIDGLSSEPASNDVDYLDGIDHILTFDHGELLIDKDGVVEEKDVLSHKKLFIGVQRTFNSAKKNEVIKDPIRILPSDNGRGVVFRIFLQENLSDYQDDKQETLMEKLDAYRREAAKKAGLSPIEYGRKHRRQGYPGVYKVLPGGQAEQVKRVLRVFEEIKKQLNDYINSLEFQKQTEYVQGQLKDLRDNLHLEDYIAAMQTVE
ncbi:MAG: hypothetical protein WCV69_04440 [Patescibacteria group bacterium]|jgi:hypothetical protein